MAQHLLHRDVAAVEVVGSSLRCLAPPARVMQHGFVEVDAISVGLRGTLDAALAALEDANLEGAILTLDGGAAALHALAQARTADRPDLHKANLRAQHRQPGWARSNSAAARSSCQSRAMLFTYGDSSRSADPEIAIKLVVRQDRRADLPPGRGRQRNLQSHSPIPRGSTEALGRRSRSERVEPMSREAPRCLRLPACARRQVPSIAAGQPTWTGASNGAGQARPAATRAAASRSSWRS